MGKFFVLLVATLILASCGSSATPHPQEVARLVQQGVQATSTALAIQASLVVTRPTASVATALPLPTATVTPLPTRTPTHTPIALPTAIPTPTSQPTPTSLPSITPTREPQITTTRAVNLRAGPGTNYPTVGTSAEGQVYPITGRNADGTWLELCCVDGKPMWVAAAVVAVSGGIDRVGIARNIPPSPTPAPTVAPIPAAPQATQAPPQPPAGWVQYRCPNGSYAFFHPPTWQEGMPMSNGSQWTIGQKHSPYYSVDVYRDANWRGMSDAQIQNGLREIAQFVADTGKSKLKVIGQGRLPSRNRAVWFEYTLEYKLVGTYGMDRWLDIVVILPDESVAVNVQAISQRELYATGDAVPPLTDQERQIIADSFRKP